MGHFIHTRAKVNGVHLHYVVTGTGPAVLCLHGWPQNHREFVPLASKLSDKFKFIIPDLRGFADSDKPFDAADYMPATIAQDMIELADAEGADKFHIVGHDWGGPPSVALAYMAGKRALSLSVVDAPYFGIDYPGRIDPHSAYWHLKMHANMDIAFSLIQGREDIYLRHFFRDFAYNPGAISEEDTQYYVMQMRQPGNLRASLNHYANTEQKSVQLAEFAKNKLDLPILSWGGSLSLASHCIDSARVLSDRTEGGVIENCGHWVFEEKPEFITGELERFWAKNAVA